MTYHRGQNACAHAALESLHISLYDLIRKLRRFPTLYRVGITAAQYDEMLERQLHLNNRLDSGVGYLCDLNVDRRSENAPVLLVLLRGFLRQLIYIQRAPSAPSEGEFLIGKRLQTPWKDTLLFKAIDTLSASYQLWLTQAQSVIEEPLTLTPEERLITWAHAFQRHLELLNITETPNFLSKSQKFLLKVIGLWAYLENKWIDWFYKSKKKFLDLDWIISEVKQRSIPKRRGDAWIQCYEWCAWLFDTYQELTKLPNTEKNRNLQWILVSYYAAFFALYENFRRVLTAEAYEPPKQKVPQTIWHDFLKKFHLKNPVLHRKKNKKPVSDHTPTDAEDLPRCPHTIP